MHIHFTQTNNLLTCSWLDFTCWLSLSRRNSRSDRRRSNTSAAASLSLRCSNNNSQLTMLQWSYTVTKALLLELYYACMCFYCNWRVKDTVVVVVECIYECIYVILQLPLMFLCFFVFLCFMDCLCGCVFFSDIIDIFSCRPIAIPINDLYLILWTFLSRDLSHF